MFFSIRDCNVLLHEIMSTNLASFAPRQLTFVINLYELLFYLSRSDSLLRYELYFVIFFLSLSLGQNKTI